MEEALLDIVAELETVEFLDDRALTKVINRHNKRLIEQAKLAGASSPTRPLSKKQLMAYYLDVQRNQPEQWARWNFSPEQQRRIVRTLQMKPRRTASGVATITVLTKPWKCSSDCLYCPNDLRMPKSYLSDEPACQRAERTFFDPYMQVTARLKALTEMGHVTDKVELIILGGTWSNYPLAYQIWFVRELFRALNEFEVGFADGGVANSRSAAKQGASSEDTGTVEGDPAADTFALRRVRYENDGLSADPDELTAQTDALQQRIFARELTYNQAFDAHYGASEAWQRVAEWQTATWQDLEAQHVRNENAAHRNVGLVIETRPDNIDVSRLAILRRLGCTKIQMGIQSLDPAVLAANHRRTTPTQIQAAFEALRLFGFKTHVHAMVNLLGSSPEADKQDYLELVTSPAYQPDEVKLYPCVLVEGTGLRACYDAGDWQPYSEEQLVDVLVADTCVTPAFTRISRMIRDISAPDIVAGNKKVNLRQMVEGRIDSQGLSTSEIRHRELSLDDAEAPSLTLEIASYETTATSERFLQWVTPQGKIAGFLRLSLPHADAVAAANPSLPVQPSEAMIREVHVYGRVAKLATAGAGGAQHQGLGTQLVEAACAMAREAGYTRINVISAVGTRNYYRKLGFYDHGLYQQREL